MDKIKQLFVFLKNSKLKFLVLVLSSLVFLFVLFPFDDLGDLVSSQVAKISGNSLYVQFEKLKMSIIPQPGVQLDEVFVESARMPALSASEIVITPSISGMIQKKPYGHVSAKGFSKGRCRSSRQQGHTHRQRRRETADRNLGAEIKFDGFA